MGRVRGREDGPGARMQTPSSRAQWGWPEEEKETLKGHASPQDIPQLEKAEGEGALGKGRKSVP